MRRKSLFRRRRRPDEKLYDAETGEELEGFLMYVPRRKTNGFGERWLAVAQDALDLLAGSDLGGADFRVLFKIFKKLDFENHLLLNQAEIADELGMHRQHVQRSLKRLIDLGVIMAGPKAKQNRTYRLNPEFGWKGSGENHKKALADHRKNQMKEAKITGVLPGGKSEEEKAAKSTRVVEPKAEESFGPEKKG